LNEAFSSYQKYEELYKLWLVVYAQVFPDFVLPSFVAPFLTRTPSQMISEIVSMGGVKKELKPQWRWIPLL
jgi:hypothetical protein